MEDKEDKCLKCEHFHFYKWHTEIFDLSPGRYHCWMFRKKPEDVENCPFFYQ